MWLETILCKGIKNSYLVPYIYKLEGKEDCSNTYFCFFHLSPNFFEELCLFSPPTEFSGVILVLGVRKPFPRLCRWFWLIFHYLLKNLRSRFQGKEIKDADILSWVNRKVKNSGRKSQIESFKDKRLSSGLFFLELLSAVEPRVVNWNLVTKGESDDEKKLNATYIISVARKLGCSIFLLPEDIMEVNQKMILILTASIMYWSLQQQPVEESDSSSSPAAVSRGASPEPSFNETPSPVSAAAFSDASSPSASANGSVSPAPSITPVSFPELNGAPSPSADVSPEPIQAPTLSKEDGSSLSVEMSHITMDDADLDKAVPANADETDADVAAVCSPLYNAKANETDADVATVFSPEVEKEVKHAL